jgi:adenylate cyclase
VLEIDPGFALAKAQLATAYTNRSGASLLHADRSLDIAFTLAKEAVALDPDLPQVHSALGIVHMFRHEYDLAEASHSRAVVLDPNFADGYAMRAWNLQYAGKPEQALKSFQYALRLNPRAPFPFLNAMAETYFSLGDYQAASDLNAQALQRNPSAQRVLLMQSVCFALLGRIDKAEWLVEELLLLEPELTFRALPAISPYHDQSTLDRLIKGARLAGLPE